MAATYYSLQDKLRTSISLNNKGIVPLEVRPTLFNLAGERLDVPPVTIDPTSFRVFDLAEWAAPGGSAFEQGSLQLFYRGKDLLLGAQIKMIDSDSSLIFDEQLTEPNSMRSSRLDGLWSIPSLYSQVRIVISNTSDLRQTAQVKLDGIEPKQEGLKELILEPHQTLVIDPALDVINRQAALMKAGGMTITHSGKPGALIARAMIENSSTGYSSSVQFIDPNKARSSKLHGAGLRIGAVEGDELTPVIVARNIGEKATTLRGRINYTRKDGSKGVMPIRSTNLSVGEAKTWEVAEVAALRRAEIRSAGLEFEYNTQAGSVMVSALSVGSRGNQVFQVPMLDPSAQTSSTGVYPFYLDYGSSTTVYIKNTTNQEQKYIAHLVYEDSRYRIGTKNIAAGETVAIDIRSLRDSQIPDEEGEVIPANITRGQLRWTRIDEGETDSLAMIGRAEQIYEGRAMSSTYACQSCCGDTPVGRFTSPPLSSVQVGQTVQMHAFEIRSDCTGWEYQVERGASWKSTDEQVATVDDNEVTFIGAGQTTIRASWNSSVPASTQCVGNPGFLPGPEPISPTTCCTNRPLPQSASETVQARPRIDRIDPPRAMTASGQIDVGITGDGFGNDRNRVVVTVGGTGISAQIDQVTREEILARFTIGSNATAGDHTVTVTVNGVASNSVNFFIQVPTRLRRDSISGLMDQQGGCGARKEISYTLLDQAGQLIDTDGTLQEVLSNFTSSPPILGAPEAKKPQLLAGQALDTVGYNIPDCPPAFTASVTQTFRLTIGQSSFNLTTTNSISMGREQSGTKFVNITMTRP